MEGRLELERIEFEWRRRAAEACRRELHMERKRFELILVESFGRKRFELILVHAANAVTAKAANAASHVSTAFASNAACSEATRKPKSAGIMCVDVCS